MEKSYISKILRESLMGKLTETEPKEAPAKEHGDEYEKSYQEIQRKLNGTLLKASQVFAAAGLGDPNDATSRSLNSKKLRRDKNEEGSTYQFDAEELAKIVKVINNPSPFLRTK
jgi:hypothetical protein